ncbi:PREDICTED: F-box/kelch-repeat protein SKIP6-like [Tarenaya hassleriana]|uniref:F-box/kelch-repeat protein SKIP6-like n=1 Tax=Tarenaya hassleriana TaxID=28532 RepID=UPI00053C52EB|nr:PREDICTED: F-box/kelch-repeat protein SKIP6-like [Tarenaya hassleriana]
MTASLSPTATASDAMDAQEPPHESSPSLSSLPCDILLNCVARVPRLYHPNLSVVSKSFRSLMVSPDLYDTRSRLGLDEHCLYVCIRLPHSYPARWFVLRRSPTSNRLVPIPSSPSPRLPTHSSVVSVGHMIYSFGGIIRHNRVSKALVMDCRNQTWRRLPRMQEPRMDALSCIVDGKVYVFGGCTKRYIESFEVFDLKTETWETIRVSGLQISDRDDNGIVVTEGKIYIIGYDETFCYDPKEGEWESVDRYVSRASMRPPFCVVDKVVYSVHAYNLNTNNPTWDLIWYDEEKREWREVEGMEETPGFSEYGTILNVDGKVVVMWDNDFPGDDWRVEVLCAEITVEREEDGEISGDVEWFDTVFTAEHVGYRFKLQCHSISL